MSLYAQSDVQTSRAIRRTATAASISNDNFLAMTICEDALAATRDETDEEVIYEVDTVENETVDARIEGRRVPKAPKMEDSICKITWSKE